jgi:hypothetical protein
MSQSNVIPLVIPRNAVQVLYGIPAHAAFVGLDDSKYALVIKPAADLVDEFEAHRDELQVLRASIMNAQFRGSPVVDGVPIHLLRLFVGGV